MMDVKILSVDDWEGLYINGKLEMENHRINVDDVMCILCTKFDIKYETREVDCDYIEDRGDFP